MFIVKIFPAQEAKVMYDELFAFCSLEDAKVISKSEREERSLLEEKVCCHTYSFHLVFCY